MASPQPGSAEITLRGLVTARWVLVALLGGAAALMAIRPEVVAPILGSVPTSKTITGYVVVLSLLAGLNVGTKHWILPRRTITTAMSGLHLLVDTAALTVLLGLTGGATNPFTTLYFVPITLATQVSPRWTWSIAVLSLAGFAGLYLLGDVPKGPPGHEHHFSGHLKGMWFSFGASGMLITYFVHRIAISLARQRIELTRLREQAFEDRHLASLGSLAAGAAHELGTPLGTIGVLAADLGLMDDDERADALVSIRGEVKRCKEIVQRMATPDARVSKLAHAAGPWSLRDLAGEAEPIRGVVVDVNISDDAASAHCDVPRESVGQIVRELLSNGAEACRRRSGAGGVELAISVDKTSAVISVRDDGEGMDADTTAAAFDPFFSTKPEGEGMGLGLYLTRAQVRQLGGTIEISSRKDRGTQVVLRFPIASTYIIKIDTETILITDDDKAFCAALSGAFRRRGFKVVVAHDYEDAISEADAWSPARAVVDLRMPGRGGLEVVSELKAKHPEMKIVVLTGYGSIATAVEAMKLGAVHYLTKPAEPDEVLGAFDRIVAAAEVPAPATPPSLEQVEWEHLQKVLTDCGGNISEAARRLGMHRRSLQRKLARGRPPADE